MHLTVTGRSSHLIRDVDVYLPPGYDDADAALRFPVIEWFPGFPGEPREVTALFGLPGLLDDAIDHDRMPPSVVVVPDTNGEPRLSHDEECVDAVAGTADDTFLSADLRSWALSRLRVRADRPGWALAGWSTGGYCAMNLALRHPAWYGTAASQSGDNSTAQDATTGDLFAGREDLRRANNVTELLHSHSVPLGLLVTAGIGERDEQDAAERIHLAVSPPVALSLITFPGGGHNTDAVRAEAPDDPRLAGHPAPRPHRTRRPPAWHAHRATRWAGTPPARPTPPAETPGPARLLVNARRDLVLLGVQRPPRVVDDETKRPARLRAAAGMGPQLFVGRENCGPRVRSSGPGVGGGGWTFGT